MSEENKDVEIDYEKLRDDKCIPVARTIMSEMATTLVASDASEVNYNDLMIKSLALYLSSDLNLTTETSYVPQLVLGALSALNKAVHECTLPMDDARYSIIAGKVLTILSEANIPLVVATKEESNIDTSSMTEKLNALFAEEKLNLIEVKYIMDNILDAFTEFSDKLNDSITDLTKRAEQKLFKVDFMNEITMKMLNDVLMAK